MRAEVSNAIAFLNRMPRSAPSPAPTMIAVGVARTSASGQAMTTKVMANKIAIAERLTGEQEPGDEGEPATGQCDEHQPEGGPVGEALPGSLGVLGLLDELDDLRQGGVGADLGGAHPQRAVAVDRGADDGRGRLLVHRQAFAGDHGLVHFAVAVLDDPVDRDLRAGTYQQQVAGDDLGGGHFDQRVPRMTTALGGARSSRVRMASLAPPRARISNQCPSRTKAARTVAAS